MGVASVLFVNFNFDAPFSCERFRDGGWNLVVKGRTIVLRCLLESLGSMRCTHLQRWVCPDRRGGEHVITNDIHR